MSEPAGVEESRHGGWRLSGFRSNRRSLVAHSLPTKARPISRQKASALRDRGGFERGRRDASGAVRRRDRNRRALAKGLIAFAREVGSHITAKGVETETELAALRAIGVDKAQGFFLAKRRALEDVVANASLPFPASSRASSA